MIIVVVLGGILDTVVINLIVIIQRVQLAVLTETVLVQNNVPVRKGGLDLVVMSQSA